MVWSTSIKTIPTNFYGRTVVCGKKVDLLMAAALLQLLRHVGIYMFLVSCSALERKNVLVRDMFLPPL